MKLIIAIYLVVLLGGTAHAAVGVPTMGAGRPPLDLIVKYQVSIAPATAAEVQSEVGVEVVSVAEVAAVDPGLRILKFRTELDLNRAVAALRADPSVVRVERASWVSAQFVPNDPRYPEQWDKRIQGAEEAWDAETGAANVIVVVSDTAARCAANPDLTNCQQGLSFDAIPTVTTEHWHGYHVAGTAAATINNNRHIAGTAQAQIALARFLNATGSGSSADGLRTINHAITLAQNNPSRPVVLNMSWGGGAFEQATQDALNQFAAVGGVAVAAAGNNSRDNCGTTKFYPASYQNVIAVASTNQDDTLSSFSNFGNCAKVQGGVLIAAPGGAPGVLSLDNTSAGTRTAQGTSMASPQVAGAIALVLSQNPNLGLDAVIARLEANAVPRPLPVIAGGRLDLPGMLEEPRPAIRVSVTCPVPTEVNQGGRLNCQVGTRGVAGFAGSIALTCSGIRCTVTPTSVPAGAGAALAVTPVQTAPLGLRTLTVRGVASVGEAVASVAIQVDPFGTRRVVRASTEDAAFGKPCFSCPRVVAETSIVVSDSLRILDLTGTASLVYSGFASDLRISVISPSNTVHVVPIPFGSFGSGLRSFAISTDVFDGQNSVGEWTLRVEYLKTLSKTGRIDGWELRIKGAPVSAAASLNTAPKG